MMAGAPNVRARTTPLTLTRDLGAPAKARTPLHANANHEVVVSDEAQRARLPRSGDVLHEKFLVEENIGVGGMSVVHQGRHLQLQTRIAIKFLRPELVANAEAVSRFLQEARLAASMESEHATRIYDVGMTKDDVPFIVMEFLRGVPLDVHLAERGPLPVADAVSVVLQTLCVLAEAHGKGLVHRDLKPANLFLQERADGALWVKVMDFGISKLVGTQVGADIAEARTNLGITAPRSLLGSPQYMSPEQLRDSSAVDHRSDIWSMGVVLYELLSGGKVPFDAPSLPALCLLILDRDPVSLRRYRGDVPPGLEDVVFETLAKDAAERPQTVGELALLLAPYAPESARTSVARINATCLRTSASRGPTPPPLVVTRRPSKHTTFRLSPALGLVMVLGVGALAYVVAPSFRERPPTSTTSVVTPGARPTQETPPPAPAESAAASVRADDDRNVPAVASAAPTAATPTTEAPPKPRPTLRAPAPSSSARIRTPSQITIVE